MSTTGAVPAAATGPTTTVTDTTAGAAVTEQPKKVISKKDKKCCFNEPGGPWPRNVMLQAVTSDDINEKLVTLIVGPEEAHFTWLHEILAFHSPFFAGAIKYSCYNESKEHIVYMPEDKPDVVREFIRWVTDHRVGGYGLGSDNPSIDPWAYWDLMTELYIFGNKYNIPRLQNVAINEIITLFRDQYAFPHAITIDKIFEETPVNATFRALVIDMVILTHENPEALIDGQDRMGDGFHPDFIKGLAKRLCQAVRHELSFDAQRLNYKQWGSDYCSYHVSEVAARSNGQRVLERAREGNLP